MVVSILTIQIPPPLLVEEDHQYPDALLNQPQATRMTASASSKSISKKQQPRVFLHIGPHKSATTTIQCALHQYAPFLKNDSMVYLGKVDLPFCGGNSKSKKQPKQDDRIRKLDKCLQDDDCWQGLTKEWDNYRTQGLDLILSKEALSDWTSSNHSDASFRNLFWDRLSTSLHDWNVTVLVTYRRYYQWLPSAHAQHSYHTMVQSNQPWPTTNSQPPTFASVLKDVLNEGQAPPYPYLDSILKFPFPSTWNVHTLTLHDDDESSSSPKKDDDIVTTLLCHIFQAPYTCQKYHAISPKRTSKAEALVYDRLNVQANLWGWMAGGRRFARMKATRQFVEQQQQQRLDTHTFPTDCPDPALLELFLERSLALERQILGSRNGSSSSSSDNKKNEEAYSRGFWNATSTFCTVNATQVLLHDSNLWKEFYQSL
jgi:hypothetical protein